MESVNLTVEHEGETFGFTAEQWVQCEHCGNAWPTNSSLERPSCSACNRRTDREYVYRYHYFIKQAWWTDPQLPADAEARADALRREAQFLEALQANGWEVDERNTDSEHMWFAKNDIDESEWANGQSAEAVTE